jgi:hypothetical protein
VGFFVVVAAVLLAGLRWRISCWALSLTETAAAVTVEAASETTDLAVSTISGSFFSSVYGGGSEDGVEVSLDASGEENDLEGSGVSKD